MTKTQQVVFCSITAAKKQHQYLIPMLHWPHCYISEQLQIENGDRSGRTKVQATLPADDYEVLKNFCGETFHVFEYDYNWRRLPVSRGGISFFAWSVRICFL